MKRFRFSTLMAAPSSSYSLASNATANWRFAHTKVLMTITVAIALTFLLTATLGGFAFADDTETNSNESSVELDIEKNAIKENQVPDSSFIYDTPLVDLANADIYYDGTTVQVAGEAVGDIINVDVPDSDYKWVALWDNNSTIVVYMSKKDAELIDTLGTNHKKGTKLQVRGVFHLTCDDHGGISDLHAENVTVQEKGRDTTPSFSIMQFVPGLIAIAVGLALFVLYRHLRNRNV